MNKPTIVELGSHRTVVLVSGKRFAIHHTPATLSQFAHAYTLYKAGDVDGALALLGVTVPTVGQAPTVHALDPTAAACVLDAPLLHSSAPGGVIGKTGHATQQHPKGPRQTPAFTDYHGKTRTVPRLSGVTVRGILLQPEALDCTQVLDEALLRQIATRATDYRGRQGVGGWACGPEAAEWYIRWARALQMAPAQLQELTNQQLFELHGRYVAHHA